MVRTYKVKYDKNLLSWIVTFDGSSQKSNFPRKRQAVKSARSRASNYPKRTGKKAKLKVYNKDGSISETRTYS